MAWARTELCLAALLVACALPPCAAAAPDAAPPLTAAERTLIVDTLRGGGEIGDTPAASLSDAVLLASLVRHATLELGLRVRPSQIDPFWAIAPKPHQVEVELQAARAEGRLGAWLTAIHPSAPRYRGLEAARSRYIQIVDAGGWRPAPDGPALRPGASGPAVAALRARLAVEGYAAPNGAPGDTFDAELQRALIEFQRHHELEPDGVVGPRTLAALNVTAEARVAQIEANLERWRWLPQLASDRMEVDVGGAQATLYAADAPRLSMRVIVGDRGHKTPMFTSRLESVVFNPPWNVPASIAAKELLPRERAHPGYFARNGFTFVDGALKQRPGPRNSLGQLKFDFPSPFGVYLHDTPGRAAFARTDRWLSHGCMRLEKPRELAAELLEPQDWTAQTIDEAIQSGDTRRMSLAKTMPLYVLYWTVVPAEDGRVNFRPDTYGWDTKLMQALAGAGSAGVKMARADRKCAAANAPQPVV